MAIINATLLAIYVASNKVAQATDASLEFSGDIIDITTKDSAGWRALLEGNRNATISGTFLFDDAIGSPNFDTFFTGVNDRVTATVRFSTGITGNKRWQVSVYVSNMTKTGGVEDAAMYNLTLEVVGTIAQTTTP